MCPIYDISVSAVGNFMFPYFTFFAGLYDTDKSYWHTGKFFFPKFLEEVLERPLADKLSTEANADMKIVTLCNNLNQAEQLQ